MRFPLACGHTTRPIKRWLKRSVVTGAVAYCLECRERQPIVDKRGVHPGQPSRANVSRRNIDTEVDGG